MRIFQLLATVLLRRNQAELVPYASMHTLYFGSESESDYDDEGTAVKPEPDQSDFKFIAG